MTKKIIVLGANSFSGQDFVDLLLSNTAFTEIIGVSRSAERSALFLKYKTQQSLDRYRYVQIDMNTHMGDLLTLCDQIQPDYIVNFAAQSEVAPSWEHPEHWFHTNTVALAEFINHIRQQKYLKKYLHISSPEVYGACVGTVTETAPVNPSTPYAASKASADLLLSVFLKQYNFPVVTVRATNVYGSRQQLFKIIPRTAIFLKLGKTIELHGGGEAIKSYIHVRDVSNGELAILENGRIGELYHLSPDQGISVKDVVKTICDVSGKDFSTATKIVPERPGQDAAYVIDSSKARNALGWKSQITINEGLTEVIEWVDTYWQEISEQPLMYIHKK
jgi:dTDP-glucose 4,6-dehydratase